MEQFTIIKKSILSSTELNSSDKLVFSVLDDRMKSSVQRANFYDHSMNDYYVIYTIEEMCASIGLRRNAVINAYKHLEALGLIIKKRQFHKATKFFIPGFKNENNTSWDSQLERVGKANSNYTNINQKRVDNTVNTAARKTQAPDSDSIQAWIHTTHNVIGLTVSTLNSIKNFSQNKINDCRKLVRIILNARNSVAIKAKIAKTAVTQFESNQNLQNELTEKLEHIFIYIKNKKMTSYYGYITNALKEYFKSALGLAKQVKIVKPVKQQIRFKTGKHKIKETLPKWAEDNYHPHYKKAPLAVRKRVQQKLADLNAGRL